MVTANFFSGPLKSMLTEFNCTLKFGGGVTKFDHLVKAKWIAYQEDQQQLLCSQGRPEDAMFLFSPTHQNWSRHRGEAEWKSHRWKIQSLWPPLPGKTPLKPEKVFNHTVHARENKRSHVSAYFYVSESQSSLFTFYNNDFCVYFLQKPKVLDRNLKEYLAISHIRKTPHAAL